MVDQLPTQMKPPWIISQCSLVGDQLLALLKCAILNIFEVSYALSSSNLWV